jgi:hypothetical protein
MTRRGRLSPRSLTARAPAVRTLSALSRPLGPWLREGVFMFHQGRCGSTVLSQLIDQHPRLAAFGEIFETPYQRRRLPASGAAMLRARRAQAFPGRAVVEAKFFECQHLALIGCDIRGFVELLRRAGYRRFIVLDRKNYLKKLVSARLAVARGRRFHVAAGEAVPDVRVRLDPTGVEILGKHAPLTEMFGYMDAQYAKLRRALEGEDVLELTYEDDIAREPRAAFGKVCGWLAVGAAAAETDLARTNRRALSAVIENWDEVADALSGTRYAWMLEPGAPAAKSSAAGSSAAGASARAPAARRP